MTELLPLDTVPLPLRLRIEDYLLLDASGAFTAYAKTELIEGVIFAVNAQFSRHAKVQRALYRALDDACRTLDSGLEAMFELSVSLSLGSMLQPDIVIARDIPENAALPGENVVLIVEIADSTLDGDLGIKARLYATAGIPEYWVADVNARRVHQLWAPAGEAYGERRELAFGERIAAATVEGLAVETVGL